MKIVKPVIVEPFNNSWKNEFEIIKTYLLSELAGHILDIEHVGSTAVEGLAAKPIIDIDIIIKDYNSFEAVKGRLAVLGYTHEGDLGIKDMQAFKYKDLWQFMRHHLYVCPQYSEQLKIHLAFRDYLRTHKEDRDWYSQVKQLAAEYYPNDIEGYMNAKTPCCLEIINRCCRLIQLK